MYVFLPYMVYFVELNGEILEALNKASIIITDKIFLEGKELIPISILDNMCKINLKNKFCSIDLQYLWFFVDKKYVYRKFSTGWKKYRVSFSSIYIDNSNEIKNIINRAYNLSPNPKTKSFSLLCKKDYVSIRDYITGKNKISLTAFLKSCQLLGFDPWNKLEGVRLYSGSSRRDNFIVFNNNLNAELYYLLNWIKLEGNLCLDRPSISISQHKSESLCFYNLINCFHNIFKISKDSIKLQNFSTRPNISALVISSAPLRQVLCLRYGIALGYKSREVLPNESRSFDREDCLKALSSEMETEGSFSKHRKEKLIYCDVSFSSYRKQYTLFVFNELKNLGYASTFIVSERNRNGMAETEYRVSFWRSRDIQKFAFEILPYFFHIKKTNNLLDVLRQVNYLKIIRVDCTDNVKNLIRKAKDKCGDFRNLTKKLNEEGLIISQKGVGAWIYQSNKVSVFAILKMASLIEKTNYFDYLPNYMAFTLWLHGYVSREKVEELRGKKDSFKHVENLIYSRRDRLTP